MSGNNFSTQDSILLPAVQFSDKGGWTVDQQFMENMGSSVLLAHGLGTAVADAGTVFSVLQGGDYKIYVRTRNWTARWSDVPTPGVFRIRIEAHPANEVPDKTGEPASGCKPRQDGVWTSGLLGNEESSWHWQKAGAVRLEKGDYLICIHDMSGFDARVDSILLTMSDGVPGDSVSDVLEMRRCLLGLPGETEEAGNFDFVVIGGGVAGICAAVAAARNGVKVALIQDRKVLGGNNSSEVRVGLGGRLNIGKYPSLGYLLNEFGPACKGNARPFETYEDDKKMQVVLAEHNISLFLGKRVTGVEKDGENVISAVTATDIETYRTIRIHGSLFADCTGDAGPGVLAGADYHMGREAASVYNEPSAPLEEDGITLGASMQWYSEEEDKPVSFPDIDWGLDLDESTAQKVRRGQWYWEVGMADDQIADAERIRDYGMYVAYSNWSYLKNHASYRDEYRNASLKWLCSVIGKRESRRLMGKFVLTENDLLDFTLYPDGCVSTSWYIDNHEPDPENASRFKDPWLSHGCLRPLDFYPIPYRCFYSRNIPNLFMAGRNISVSHLALGTTRVMRTCAMMGEVVGMAASLCKRHDCRPDAVLTDHWDELDAMMHKGAGKTDMPYLQVYTLVDTTGARSEDC